MGIKKQELIVGAFGLKILSRYKKLFLKKGNRAKTNPETGLPAVTGLKTEINLKANIMKQAQVKQPEVLPLINVQLTLWF